MDSHTLVVVGVLAVDVPAMGIVRLVSIMYTVVLHVCCGYNVLRIYRVQEYLVTMVTH